MAMVRTTEKEHSKQSKQAQNTDSWRVDDGGVEDAARDRGVLRESLNVLAPEWEVPIFLSASPALRYMVRCPDLRAGISVALLWEQMSFHDLESVLVIGSREVRAGSGMRGP